MKVTQHDMLAEKCVEIGSYVRYWLDDGTYIEVGPSKIDQSRVQIRLVGARVDEMLVVPHSANQIDVGQVNFGSKPSISK